MMDKKLILDFDKNQKKHKRQKESGQSSSGGSKSKHPKVDEVENAKLSANYRDRAQERREGKNRDFELDPEDLRITNPTYEDGDQAIDEAELRRQQIEESKYLGGDVEHTHLVKGLDFALLEKVKTDQKLAEKLNESRDSDADLNFGDDASDSEEEEFRNQAILAATVASTSKRHIADLDKLKRGKSTEVIPCKTAIARRILNVLDEKWPAKSELFLPGRMSYIVPIDEERDDPVTTILRSKADTSAIQDSKLPDDSDLAMDQLINILGKIRKGQTSTSLAKKQRNWDIDEDYI